MQIPVGLMSPTALRNQRTDGGPNQGYWQGDRYIAPKYKPKPPPSLMSPDIAAAVQMLDDSAKQAQQTAAQIPSMWGDGAQGEGFSGGRDAPGPNTSPDMSEAGHTNQGLNANVAGMMSQPAVGIPSLPDFVDTATPASQTAPANQGLAVSEVDPQGAPGAAKGTAQAANPAHNEQGLAARSAVNKGLAEDQAAAAIGKAQTAFTDAIAGLAKSTPAISAQDASDMGSRAAVAAENTGPAGVPGSNQNSPNAVGGLTSKAGLSPAEVAAVNAGLAAASGGENNGGTQGGIGATGNPGPGNDTSGTAAADAGGSWKRGGRTGGDKDGKKDEVRGKAHEHEFVLNRPMTSLMDQKAPGFLDAMDRFQKGLMDRPRRQAKGLMGR